MIDKYPLIAYCLVMLHRHCKERGLNEKIVKRISALFIGLALMVALPVAAHASTNDDQQDIASLDMSVIDVHIQSRGVMTAEDLYDFLQSDAEKTVDIDAETGKITAVSEGTTKPRIAVCPDMCRRILRKFSENTRHALSIRCLYMNCQQKQADQEP